jgi:hypothetical protein
MSLKSNSARSSRRDVDPVGNSIDDILVLSGILIEILSAIHLSRMTVRELSWEPENLHEQPETVGEVQDPDGAERQPCCPQCLFLHKRCHGTKQYG